MKIAGIDHIVMTVADIARTVEFYQAVLGMTVERFGQGRVALKFGSQKINLHQHGNEFEPKAERPMPGSQDLCLITPTDLEVAMEHVRAAGVEILDGPIARTGATGPLLSFYFRDPDNNLIEVANLR